jgi:2',3'-cyclic-nucleotide 2'-phosphodiesterase (5'-nucleotidase family)
MINGKYGQSFGYLTLNFHAEDGSVSVDDAKSTDFCARVFPDTHNCLKGTGTPIPAAFLGQTVAPDPTALALLSADIQKAQATAAQVVGKLITPLTKSDGSTSESSIGELMADAFRLCADSTCTKPADIGIQNNGGIRSPLIAAGSVNYGEVFELDPFDDYRSVLQMKGSQVHDLLAGFWAYGSFLNQVSGIKVTYSPSSTTQRTITNPAGQSKTVTDPVVSIIMADGTPFDESRTYSVVMTDFLATGGSGAGTTVNGMTPSINYGRLLRDAILDYFKANPNGLDYSLLGGRLINQDAASK